MGGETYSSNCVNLVTPYGFGPLHFKTSPEEDDKGLSGEDCSDHS